MTDHSSFQVFLHSTHSTPLSDGTHFFDMSHVIDLHKPRHTTFISVRDAQIPHAYYNIHAKNNWARFTNSDMDLQLPQGNYEVSNYASTGLVDVINAHLKTNFYPNEPSVFQYDLVTGRVTATFPEQVTLFRDEMSVWQSLGFFDQSRKFTVVEQVTIPANTPTTSRYIANINARDVIYLMASGFNSPNVDTRRTPTHNVYRGNVLARIPVNTCPGSTIHYDPNVEFKMKIQPLSALGFQLSLEDERGDVIDLNGCPFSLTIQVDYSRNDEDPPESLQSIRDLALKNMGQYLKKKSVRMV
jgi:hypothetical protein